MILCGALAAGVVFYSTRNEKKEYQTFSIINTGVVTGYNIESGQGARIDFGFANNEIENMLSLFRSRETQKELAVRLLANALLAKKPDYKNIGTEAFSELKTLVPADIQNEIAVPGDTVRTTENVREWLMRPGDNPVKKLIESDNALFGLENLQTMTIKREGSTDMIRISHKSTDPAICQSAVAMLTEMAIVKHRNVKEGQSGAVLAFFEKATSESARDLAGREDGLLNFMVNNKIINYYEQTRFIAAKKEDLDEFYFKELMTLAAADSSRRTLETRLNGRVNLPEINKNLLAQREQLAGISAQLAALEIGPAADSLEAANANGQRPNSASKLQKQAQLLKNGMRQNAEAIFAVNRTPDGLETKNLLGKWLDQSLDVEQTLARLEVLRERKTEFDRIYSRFAPWGSKLKRIEREIDVAERAYLENLHSFNQARLHKHNLLMSNSLRVVDAPFFPEKATPSKRAMLVIVAGLAGFLLVFGAALALEFLDSTLHDLERAAETTGLELAAAFPRLPKNWQNDASLDYAFLMQRGAGQLLQHLKLTLRERGISRRPARIALLSTRENEGKSMVSEIIISQLRLAGERVLWLRKTEHTATPESHPDDRFYAVDHTFFEKKDEKALIGGGFSAEETGQFDYIFTEIPAILANTYPADYLAKTDFALFFARTDRTWNRADGRALATLTRVLGHPCSLVLNFVRPDDLENALGEVPKRRSKARQVLKKIVTLNFSGSRG